MVFLFFIFGLLFGSLSNVLIYRLPKDEGWVNDRSYCPKCKHMLHWYDLVPVLSWLWLRGKCRYCKSVIHWRYPVVELCVASLWALVGYGVSLQWLWSGWGVLGEQGMFLLRAILIALVLAMLLVITIIDWEHYIIPDELVVGISICVLILGVSIGFVQNDWNEILTRIYWGLGGSAFLGSLYVLTKGKGMGLGDVKFAFAMGMVLQRYLLVAMMSAFIIGAVYGSVLLLTKRKSLGQPIPFGPFLVLGMLIGLWFGQGMVEWYLRVLV